MSALTAAVGSPPSWWPREWCCWQGRGPLASSRPRGSLRPRPLRHYRRRNSSPRTEIPFHLSPHRPRPAHHIFQHAVHNVLLKNSQIAVRLQIFLVRFQLETNFVRPVTQRDHTKIRQSRLWTHRRKLRIVNHNLISRKLVRPGLNFRKLRVQPSSSVLRRVTWLAHAPL